MFVFRKTWRTLFFPYLRFEIRPFALLPMRCGIIYHTKQSKKFYHLTFSFTGRMLHFLHSNYPGNICDWISFLIKLHLLYHGHFLKSFFVVSGEQDLRTFTKQLHLPGHRASIEYTQDVQKTCWMFSDVLYTFHFRSVSRGVFLQEDHYNKPTA